MSWMRFFRRRRWDEERARELEAYLESETDENIAHGESPDEARHAARRKLGNPTLIREEIYHMNTLGFVESTWQDLRHSLRLLRLAPSFTTVAILSLALGIGANTAIFQLLDAVRLRALPVKDPQQIAEINFDHRGFYAGSSRAFYPSLTNPLWEQIRDRQQGFSGVTAFGAERFNMARGGEARYAQGLFVSGEFFKVLGVPPILGRVFTHDDDRRGCSSPGAVISYGFWQREFGGAPGVVGRNITLESHPFTIVGVTPASFYGVEMGRTFDVAVPLCAEPITEGESSLYSDRAGWWLAAIGRLKPGWSLAQATSQLHAISKAAFAATLPEWYGAGNARQYTEGFLLRAVPASAGISKLREQYEYPLSLLLGIAGFVLLIACANLANLLLARTSAREREIAVRLALGASRTRLVRQLLTESILLAAGGGLAGILLARNLSSFLVSFLSTQDNPLFVDLRPDWRVLAFTTALAALTCVLFGVAPALRATRAEPNSAMRAGGRGLTAGRERFGLRRMLVVSQVALSLVLLVGALLFVRSLRNLTTLDAGFRQSGILIAAVDFSSLGLPQERRQALKHELVQHVAAVPGVDSVAETIPLQWGDGDNTGVLAASADHHSLGETNLNSVSTGYFKTLGIALVAGRDFDSRDTLKAPKVAVVNEEFRRKFIEAANPLGQRVRIPALPPHEDHVYTVVGVVRNAKYQELREEFQPILYFAESQDEHPAPAAHILIHSQTSLTALTTGIKAAIGQVNPEIGIEFHVFQTQLRNSILRDRLMATLSGFFGFLAVVLATVGLYGVISYMVARRRNEIGIRMALGADSREVVRMILREAGWLLLIGLSIGVLLSLAIARTAASFLFGLQPHDPSTITLAIALLGAVAIAASCLPARRAARLDPLVALREE
ncbi:MAG TPA: ABC transporter permease [Bryobacteraceae bacterium]|nr:ABC transporter permease [Bryobacteraceae bacterium]